MNTSSSFAKAWFVLSVAVFSFGYGFAAHAWDLFPKNHIVTFVNQVGRQAPAVFREDPTDHTTPQVFDRSGVRREAPEQKQPGMTLITSSWQWDTSDDLRPGAKLIDRRGRTMHTWTPDRSGLFPGPYLKGGDPMTADFHGSYLFPNGDLLLALNYIGAVRLDACGDVVWTLAEGIHHSIARAEDGSFWMSGVSKERRTTTDQHPEGFPGLDTSVWMDRLLHVSADGEVLDDINVLDVLYANGLERYVLKAHARGAYTPSNGDPTHLNDVEPLSPSMADEYPLLESGDLLVSLKHPNLVLVLDPDSETVKWHADSTPSDDHHLLQHHDPDFMGAGWIGVFNNREDFTDRGSMLGGGQILAFQPRTDSARVLFPTPNSDSIYTENRGKWQYLENGNLLLTESNAGRVLEVTPDGRTVWEWIHPPHGESQVPFVTEGSRYDLSRSEVSAWACSAMDSVPASSR